MSLDRDGLLSKLAELTIVQDTITHALSPTCDVHSDNIRGTAFEKYIGKGQAKNLFFKVPSGGGKLKNRLFLVCALTDTEVDNKGLSTRLGIKASAPLRLAADDIFDTVLQIPKGSVNPFVLAQGSCAEVTLLLDDKFKACEKLLFHPMQSDYTTALSPSELDRFLDSVAPGRWQYVDLAAKDSIKVPEDLAAAPAPAAAAPKKSTPPATQGGGAKAAPGPAAISDSWPSATAGHELHWHLSAYQLLPRLQV
eukprot:TRINITY_DN92527_c0_g1_i1.p1 TRINITY_DN92527_c0_g1~~TRINITY_DN92527_c0_g1_i1.p1  ORF type:complete len:283 (-),score=75.96 TRINITY_DN92527_c0_g1_i1:121-876(-)